MSHRPVPLDLLFPRPVLVELAGEQFKAGELCLGDLATLQSWLRQAAPHPLADVPPVWAEPEPQTRRGRLLAAWQAAKTWPPLLGSDDDRPYLDSPEGRAVFLVLVLGKWDEAFTAEDATSLAARMGPSDWDRLRRVAWNVAPWRPLAWELDEDWRTDQARKSGEPTDWAGIVASVIKATGLDYAALQSWTPTQLRAVCSEGRHVVDEYRATTKAGETPGEMGERMRRTFGPIPGPDDPQGA